MSARRAARTSAAHSTSWSRVSGKRRPLGVAASAWPERPIRCSPVAIERGEPIRQQSSTAPTSMPSSSEAVATTTLRSPAFKRRSARWRRSRERLPWWAATLSTPEALAEVQRDPLDQAARVDEHQRRLVLARQGRDPIVELRPLFVGGDGAELVLGHLDAEVEIAPLADVDQRRRGPRPADQQPRRDLERPDRRRQADALEPGSDSPARRAAPARAPGGRRACRAPRRGFRRRSPCARRAAPSDPTRRSAGCRATRAW